MNSINGRNGIAASIIIGLISLSSTATASGLIPGSSSQSSLTKATSQNRLVSRASSSLSTRFSISTQKIGVGTSAVIGTGRPSLAVIGTGQPSNAVIGTGKATPSYNPLLTGSLSGARSLARSKTSPGSTTLAVIGTGAPTGVIGTGSPNAVIGTGAPSAVIGTGIARTITANGSTNAVIGTGAPSAVIGTGAPNAVIGTGSPNAVIGTGGAGSRFRAVIGTGHTTRAVIGTGRQ